ncbi:MAG: 2-oxoglutarate dehydrogenase E1 component, partial [Armatimonadetes bacterium]|nr:2-oxoglutarate dehydrogenase E1 component [Armatimonadota bacterium]
MKDTLSLYHGPNAGYVLELYERYREDPQSVDAETRALFDNAPPPEELLAPAGETPAPPRRAAPEVDISKIVGAARLARMIREVGHLGASIDPLGSPSPGDPGLRLGTHGLSTRDLVALPASVVGGPIAEQSKNALEAISILRVAYSSTIGYEDDHIQIAEERRWLRNSIESRRFFNDFSEEEKRVLLNRLTEVELFERFLHQTYIGQKRFSIEGCDMLVPMLDLILSAAADAGVGEVVMGMAHRGRLNVLAHVLGKPYSAILAAFQSMKGESAAESDKGTYGWSGDVKYHQGAGRIYSGKRSDMPVSLASNPSHLEFVDPVVLGRTRAAQERRHQPGPPVQDPQAAGSILIHGDAAFPGQGVVAETLNLSQIPGYSVGGTIHIILNNQIGFTTSPREGRSTLYASDLAKGYEIPIVHVNADDPMACIAAARMAYAYCREFHKDFLIDLVGYRRWGHNEGDEPTFTQPRMYQVISQHPTVRELWARSLEREEIVTREDVEAMEKTAWQRLQEARDEPVSQQAQKTPTMTALPPGQTRHVETAVPVETVRAINDALFTPPENFNVNSKLERLMARRREGLGEPGGIDWGHAEALAFGTILAEGTPIRMTGQDVERGTFSHRHLVLNDPKTGGEYSPLQTLPAAKASFAIYNSPLSEMAVLGFEYGYTRHAPGTLVLWEAQFGDFANSAQVIIDQFIVAGYAKWRQTPTLVMLLPHGYEGPGPEHSSA